MEKKKKIGILILLLALVYVCCPLPAEEKDMDWLWYEVGFWPVLETEVEMTPVEVAEEKNHIWLPGLLTEGQLRITRYEMDYSRCDLEAGETEPISEEDYMTIKAATQEK